MFQIVRVAGLAAPASRLPRAGGWGSRAVATAGGGLGHRHSAQMNADEFPGKDERGKKAQGEANGGRIGHAHSVQMNTDELPGKDERGKKAKGEAE